MLNVDPSSSVFLKTYNTEFDEISIRFADQNGRPLEIEDKVNLAFYRTKNKKIRERIWTLSFGRKYKKELLDTGIDALKSVSKKVVHKAGEFIGSKIADTVTKSSDDKTEKQKPVEEKKRDEILNKLRRVL